MADSPSHKWKDGVLSERAIATEVAGDPDEAVSVTGRPNDVPSPNSTFGSRSKGRSGGSRSKAVTDDDTENKAVKAARKK